MMMLPHVLVPIANSGGRVTAVTYTSMARISIGIT
jgi:hypothetical protein